MIADILNNLWDREILITNTFEKNSLGYNLAHLVRNITYRTWCVDKRYEMTKEKEGYRIIEDGRVILLKGDLETERTRIYDIIHSLDGKIDFEIDIK